MAQGQPPHTVRRDSRDVLDAHLLSAEAAAKLFSLGSEFDLEEVRVRRLVVVAVREVRGRRLLLLVDQTGGRSDEPTRRRGRDGRREVLRLDRHYATSDRMLASDESG